MTSTSTPIRQFPSGGTYSELIRRGALQHGPRTAIVFGDKSFTFGEVDLLSDRLANALHAIGATHGKRIAILLSNGLYSVPMDFACVKAGVNRVPLNTRLSLAEHARMIAETGCTELFFGPDQKVRAQELLAAVSGVRGWTVDGSIDGLPDILELAQSLSAGAPDVATADDDVVMTLFTSGTTGTLKAAQHTQVSYAAVCRNVLLNLLPATRDDAMLHAASMIHASGLFVLPLWVRGGRTVILPGFEPGLFLRTIQSERITAVNMVPTMMQMLLEHPEFATTDVAALQYVIYGASPMPRPVIERAMAVWGRHRFWQYYGQTEAPLCLAVLRPEDHHGDTLGACGQPGLDVEIRLVDDLGRDVPPGTPGEITVRGPIAIRGYRDAPELNAQTFDAQGWVRTRDVGLFDERGFLYLKDRTSDMIISGGYNIYPNEVENVLMAHPAVLECAVIGLPHEKWVEMVTAVVVLRAGRSASEPELIDHVAAQLASYKKPHQVFFANEIPKTAVGKLNRKRLREQFRPL